MDMHLDRRAFTLALPGAGLCALGLAHGALARPDKPVSPDIAADGPWPGFPRQNPELVRTIVGAAHRDEAQVRELLDRHPALANAWWDWGFGDWESPLGAASHTGRRTIAELLIARGARVDIFAAAMLGWTDVVKSLVAASPGVQRTLGPHGITLLQHARTGGDEARGAFDYLSTLGDADTGPAALAPITAAQLARYAGTYGFGPAPSASFTIALKADRVEFVLEGQATCRLHHVGDHTFFPAGVPSVKFGFDAPAAGRDGELSQSVTIIDHEWTVRGERR